MANSRHAGNTLKRISTIIVIAIVVTGAFGSRGRAHTFASLRGAFRPDTIYTAYDRMIDSLADLNLSLDSLRRMGLADSIIFSIDSIYKVDSIASIIVYTPQELKRMRKDSIRAYKDSVIRSTPRILNTYVFPDSLTHTRMISWKHNTYTNSQELLKIDTSFNYHFHELPFQRDDIGAQYLGVAGSAALTYNYFKRECVEEFPFFDEYTTYTYMPNTLPFYNTKTPYTELAYWGTLFANRRKSEDNIKFLHTQNFTPSFNFTLLYQREGGGGLLDKEDTDFRTFSITGNYLGKKYVAQGGYIFSRLNRTDNGGVRDLGMIRDTTVDVRTIELNLDDASQKIKRNTLFITQSYGIPIRWRAQRDSLGNKIKDTLGADQGTVTFFGHYGEFSTFSRSYEDEISMSDSVGRAFYNNNFFINPTTTYDSVRVMKLENRLFIKIQPWSDNAIVSKLDGGIGHQLLSIYGFNPEYYLSGNLNKNYTNIFTYFGASGKFRRYFAWNALAHLDIAGYYKGSMSIDASMKVSSWRVPEGIHLTAKFHSSLKTPSYFYNNYYSNHYIWNNNFDKISLTKLEGLLQIPHWNFEAQFGYALADKNIYLDSLGMAHQNDGVTQVLSGYLSHTLKLGVLRLQNRILFQTSSNQDIIPLPTLALNLRYYLQFSAVKNVLEVQLGADMTYNTKYYAQKYSPALGMFYNQKEEKFGDNPYIDIFLNLQWKRACIFVKMENAGQGWPKREYFSAYGYIRPQTAFKVGIWWPFYIN